MSGFCGCDGGPQRPVGPASNQHEDQVIEPSLESHPRVHPDPEVRGRAVQQGDPVPTAARRLHRRAEDFGWTTTMTYARGRTLKTAGSGPVVDNILLRGLRKGQAWAAVWEAGRFRCAYSSRTPSESCPPRLSLRELTQVITSGGARTPGVGGRCLPGVALPRQVEAAQRAEKRLERQEAARRR